MNLLRNIVAGVWMVDKPTIVAAAPFITRLAKGEEVKWEYGAEKDRRPFAYWQRNNARYYDLNTAPPESVAVHTVIGAVTKYGGWCGGGTEEMMKKMEEADRMENIVAHLLEIDSGGGEATNIETVARFIRNLSKPVVAVVNGVAASAAYYIAAAADEIYATEATDEFGSIGVVMSFADVRPMWEAAGVKFHEIYASQSTLKNEDFHQALDGNYEAVRSKMLDPYAEAFIKTVKEFRPNLKDDGQVFKGETYMAPAAKKLGLIDGLKTWEAAAERAIQLGKKKRILGSREAAAGRHVNSNQSDLNMSTKKNYARIASVLGYQLETDEDGGIYLQAQELASIERRLNASEPAELTATLEDTSALDAIRAQNTEMVSTLTAINSRLETMSADLQAQNDRLTRLEDRTPGASVTLPRADGDPASEVTNEDLPADVKKAEETFARALKAERREW